MLAGAVLALRVLPPLTRFAERFVDRRPWTATMFGMWQAGRRPHAGPVLLLALAVGGSTLAWSLISTGERSQVEQAGHTVGADLRVTERAGVAPPTGPVSSPRCRASTGCCRRGGTRYGSAGRTCRRP